MWHSIQHSKNPTEKQHTFRSPNGKEKHLDCVVIDRSNRRYCTDAEANDMIHFGSDHRSVTAHFRFPCAKKKEGLENKKKTETESLQRCRIHEIPCISGATRWSQLIRKSTGSRAKIR